MPDVWCVEWVNRSGGRVERGSCATRRGKRPDPDAQKDATRCRQTVVLRVGSFRGEPSCSLCRRAMGLPQGDSNA